MPLPDVCFHMAVKIPAVKSAPSYPTLGFLVVAFLLADLRTWFFLLLFAVAV